MILTTKKGNHLIQFFLTARYFSVVRSSWLHTPLLSIFAFLWGNTVHCLQLGQAQGRLTPLWTFGNPIPLKVFLHIVVLEKEAEEEKDVSYYASIAGTAIHGSILLTCQHCRYSHTWSILLTSSVRVLVVVLGTGVLGVFWGQGEEDKEKKTMDWLVKLSRVVAISIILQWYPPGARVGIFSTTLARAAASTGSHGRIGLRSLNSNPGGAAFRWGDSTGIKLMQGGVSL
jgi:hypothetical protein